MPTLNWIGKKAVLNHDRDVPFHLLEEVPELSFGDKNSGNLIVQGDNLVALKSLLPYYAGKVKCIYIDPPYNTGNEGWIYNDNVNDPEIKAWINNVVGKEAEDLSRHDKWLCMMYPRLKLLREFLREDGAIFISLDDVEIAHLRMISDEIFGAQNFVTNIIWHKNYAPKSSSKYFSEDHDYILVYAKSKVTWGPFLLPRTEAQNKIYKNPDNDPRGLWRPDNLSARNPYSLGIYQITCPGGRVIPGPPAGRYWVVSEEKFKAMDADGRIYWGKDGNNVPAPKRYMNEVMQGRVPQTIWPFEEVGHTQDAKKEIVQLFGNEVFDTPKPEQLIQRILQVATCPGDIVMDSYLGSGTTCAVAHKMGRRYIGIEMGTHCETHCALRLKKVIEGEQGGVSKTQKWTGGGGFRYYRLGMPLFDEYGNVFGEVKFADLAKHVYFSETGEPLPDGSNLMTPFIGSCHGRGLYLLYNGILKDKNPRNGNVLTREVLTMLPPFDGPKVVYGTGCRLSAATLRRERITFKQIPYELAR